MNCFQNYCRGSLWLNFVLLSLLIKGHFKTQAFLHSLLENGPYVGTVKCLSPMSCSCSSLSRRGRYCTMSCLSTRWSVWTPSRVEEKYEGGSRSSIRAHIIHRASSSSRNNSRQDTTYGTDKHTLTPQTLNADTRQQKYWECVKLSPHHACALTVADVWIEPSQPSQDPPELGHPNTG